MVKKAFSNDPAFVGALDKACRIVVNENSLTRSSSKSPEYLAKYCDVLLRKGNKNIEENELEDKLAQIVLFVETLTGRSSSSNTWMTKTSFRNSTPKCWPSDSFTVPR